MDEEELIFKRFPEDKQDQIRGLVNYATLMGLTGKDLVSIGGKLDRLRAARERKANIDIIKSYNCIAIGRDLNARNRDYALDQRFKLKTATDVYMFENKFGQWRISNTKTHTTRSHSPREYEYELGTVSWQRRTRYALLLDINAGVLQLNF